MRDPASLEYLPGMKTTTNNAATSSLPEGLDELLCCAQDDLAFRTLHIRSYPMLPTGRGFNLQGAGMTKCDPIERKLVIGKLRESEDRRTSEALQDTARALITTARGLALGDESANGSAIWRLVDAIGILQTLVGRRLCADGGITYGELSPNEDEGNCFAMLWQAGQRMEEWSCTFENEERARAGLQAQARIFGLQEMECATLDGSAPRVLCFEPAPRAEGGAS